MTRITNLEIKDNIGTSIINISKVEILFVSVGT